MRIYDEDDDKALENVSLFLTVEEAKEMIDTLEGLILQAKNTATHAHLNDGDYEHEITVTIYDENKLDGLHERIKKLIIENR
jgi:hypothetical protein